MQPFRFAGKCIPHYNPAMTPQEQRRSTRRFSWFSAVAPGILIAATGVGAGDLMTAGLGGSAIGVSIVWAALAGAFLKWFLNEGIARWQMATQTTLLEGWVERLGGWIRWVFVVYLLVWSFAVGGALVNACGVAGSAICSLGDVEFIRAAANAVNTGLGIDTPLSPDGVSKIAWGIIHSLVGLVLVWFGGFKLFERFMAVCIGLMFVTVLWTAKLLGPDWGAMAESVIASPIPPSGTKWILGLMGGVGGTVTMLSYGYWIREAGRIGASGVRACRIDLAIGYSMTAMFGIAMVIIGSRVRVSGHGETVALDLARQLQHVLGDGGQWLFLIGFWGAVFSSLLGVWQGIPYLFADFVMLRSRKTAEERGAIDYTRTWSYRAFLVGLALLPLILLWTRVQRVQLAYAVLGALFLPLLAVTLLIMNNRTAWVGRAYRSRLLTNIVLALTLLFFAWIGVRNIAGHFNETKTTQSEK